MTLDTRDKRASAISVMLPWRSEYPAPAGTITARARQIIALLSGSITSSEITTALKRLSAIHMMCPWRGILPLPTGSVTKGDRPVPALLYTGVSGGGGGVSGGNWLILMRRRLRR